MITTNRREKRKLSLTQETIKLFYYMFWYFAISVTYITNNFSHRRCSKL